MILLSGRLARVTLISHRRFMSVMATRGDMTLKMVAAVVLVVILLLLLLYLFVQPSQGLFDRVAALFGI